MATTANQPACITGTIEDALNVKALHSSLDYGCPEPCALLPFRTV